MDDKTAAKVLIKLLERSGLSGEEREAIRNAIGILSWTSLAKSRLKTKQEKMDEEMKKQLQ